MTSLFQFIPRLVCRMVGHSYDEWAAARIGPRPGYTLTLYCARCGKASQRG